MGPRTYLDHYNTFNCKFNSFHLHFTYLFARIACCCAPDVGVGRMSAGSMGDSNSDQFAPAFTAHDLTHLEQLPGMLQPSLDS